MQIKSNGDKENGLKPKEGRFKSDSRKKFFTIRVVTNWNGLPREVVDNPPLGLFKTRLDRDLNLLESVLAHGREVRSR